MANFSTSDMGTPSGSPFSPSRPQVDETPSQVLSVLGSALEMGGEIKKGRDEARANAQANSVLNQFTQENLKLAEAVDQGLMTSQEARMRGRKTFSQFVSNNPALYDDLTSRQSDIFDQAGLGKVIAEGTDMEQAGISLQKEAIGAGWVRADASPERLAEATADYADFKRANEELSAMQARVSFESSQVGLESSKLSLMQARKSEKSRKALFNLSSSYTPKFRSDMDALVERMQTGEVSQEEAVREAQVLWSQVQTTVNQVGDRAGSEHISNLSAPMKSMYENTVAHIKGDLSLDLLNTQNEKALALAQKNWLEDPELASLAAGSRLFPNSDILTHAQINWRSLQHLRKNSDPQAKPADMLSDDPDERAAIDTTLRMLKQNMSASTGRGVDDDTEAELTTNLTGVLRGIQAYGPNTTRASEYQQVVDFLASPEFGSYTTKRGGVPADVASNASQVLQEQYEQAVLPLLRQEYETGAVASGLGFSTTGIPNPTRTTQNVSSAIKPVFRGGGVTFQVEGEQGPTSTAGSKAKALNKRVSPILNRLIRMAAHLEGHQDYRKVYEDRYVSIFGEEDQEEGNE